MKKWERLNELEAEQEKLKEKVKKENQLPISGSSTKMGSSVFSSRKEKKDMEGAYNKLQNMREQEIENNAVKIKELRKEVYGSNAESAKEYNKGGIVKSKSKPAVAIMIGMAPAKKMAKGGKMGYASGGMAMVEKDGKMVPSFAADGVGKMAKGGMAKFEKSKKDVEKKGMKEGSKADMALDKKQMMAKGGAVKKKPMKGIINKFIR